MSYLIAIRSEAEARSGTQMNVATQYKQLLVLLMCFSNTTFLVEKANFFAYPDLFEGQLSTFAAKSLVQSLTVNCQMIDCLKSEKKI